MSYLNSGYYSSGYTSSGLYRPLVVQSYELPVQPLLVQLSPAKRLCEVSQGVRIALIDSAVRQLEVQSSERIALTSGYRELVLEQINRALVIDPSANSLNLTNKQNILLAYAESRPIEVSGGSLLVVNPSSRVID